MNGNIEAFTFVTPHTVNNAFVYLLWQYGIELGMTEEG